MTKKLRVESTNPNREFLDRVNMKPGNARAIVDVTVSVETGSWGPDCTVAQAVAQAVKSAQGKLHNALSKENGIYIQGARLIRVVCDAEPSTPATTPCHKHRPR